MMEVTMRSGTKDKLTLPTKSCVRVSRIGAPGVAMCAAVAIWMTASMSSSVGGRRGDVAVGPALDIGELAVCGGGHAPECWFGIDFGLGLALKSLLALIML
jgi:hypothetical protein